MTEENRVTLWTLGGIVALFCAAWAIGTIGIGDVPDLVEWQTDPRLADGIEGATGKLTFVEFTAPGCPPCQRMAREVFSQPAVAEALGAFVPVRLDISDPDADRRARRFGIPGVPTFLVLRPDGTVLQARSGFLSVEAFLDFLMKAQAAHAGSRGKAISSPGRLRSGDS